MYYLFLVVHQAKNGVFHLVVFHVQILKSHVLLVTVLLCRRPKFLGHMQVVRYHQGLQLRWIPHLLISIDIFLMHDISVIQINIWSLKHGGNHWNITGVYLELRSNLNVFNFVLAKLLFVDVFRVTRLLMVQYTRQLRPNAKTAWTVGKTLLEYLVL